jgi:hypothetical protein
MILIIGAFMEAYIIGGITAEMGAVSNIQNKFINNVEYVKYSMALNKFPPFFQKGVFMYMNKCQESLKVSKDLGDM